MDFEYMKTVRRFVSQELGDDPLREVLQDKALPVYDAFRATGLANWWLPQELGCHGLSLEDSVEIVNEIAYADAGVAFTLFISILSSSMLLLYGSDELKVRYLEPMAAQGSFCATLASERTAGSELGKLETRYTQVGDSLLITGEKFFSTNTDFADFLVVIARERESEDTFSAIVVPRDTAGVEILKRWDVIGVRTSYTYQVRLDSCRVPATYRLEGSGLRLLEIGLNASRILIATTGLGIARRIRDQCMAYAKEKLFRKGVLLDSPVFAQRLGQMEMQIDVMKSHLLQAARDYDKIMTAPDAAATFAKQGTLKSALTAKLFCGQAGWDVASVGSEMFGGLGYTNEVVLGKLMRDMRYVSIVEGGDDVLRELLFGRYVVPVSRRT